MKADRAEVSWDAQKNKWLVRIIIGEEVIRRFCDDSRTVEPAALRASVLRTVREEGYEIDPASITLST
jgi:hypothetical protein